MTALAATLHDPSGALVPLIRRTLPVLRKVYRDGLAVAVSPPTHARVVRLLEAAGAYAGAPAANLRGPLYRLSVRAALATGAAHVHYLDFDRAIHWAAGRPRELAAAVRVGRRFPVCIVGRTDKAHRSHQRPLYATETVVNRLIADRLGWSGRVDLLAPSVVLGRTEAGALLRASRSRDDGIYGEWAAIVPRLAPTIAYLECGGLDWETPDRFRRAIARRGLARWRTRFETRAEWAARVEIAAAIVRAFERRLGTATPAAPRLVRLRPRTAR